MPHNLGVGWDGFARDETGRVEVGWGGIAHIALDIGRVEDPRGEAGICNRVVLGLVGKRDRVGGGCTSQTHAPSGTLNKLFGSDLGIGNQWLDSAPGRSRPVGAAHPDPSAELYYWVTDSSDDAERTN